MKTGAYRRKKITNAIIHTMLAILSVAWIFPLVWVVLTSLRAGKGSYSKDFIPKQFTFSNFTRLFTETSVFDFPQWFAKIGRAHV